MGYDLVFDARPEFVVTTDDLLYVEWKNTKPDWERLFRLYELHAAQVACKNSSTASVCDVVLMTKNALDLNLHL